MTCLDHACLSALCAVTGALPLSARRTITRGDELTAYDFTRPASFEERAYGRATLRRGVRARFDNLSIGAAVEG